MVSVNAPKYFIAIFGDPGKAPNNKDKVEEGRYITHPNHWPSSVSKGDIMLLYCTGSYPDHCQEAPGIGVVLELDSINNSIMFRYLPLVDPIDMSTINLGLLSQDARKFGNRRFSTFWIFEILKDSFVNVMLETKINWA